MLLFSSSCSYKATNQTEADSMIRVCHQAIQAKEFGSLIKLYDSSFGGIHSADRWEKVWLSMTRELGEIREFRPLYSQKDARYRGDYYIYLTVRAFKTRFGEVSGIHPIFKAD